MSPEHLEAWIGAVTGAAGLAIVTFRGLRKGFATLQRVETALATVQNRTVELDRNGGESIRDNAERARIASERALVLVEDVVDRFDRHLEQHASLPAPRRRTHA